MPKIVYKVLLFVSLAFNIALYFGWLGLEQYKDIVDKGVQTTKDIANDPSTQNFIDMAKKKLKNAYGEDVENLKEKLKGNTKEAAMKYMMENYSGLDLSDMAQIVEEADLKDVEGTVESASNAVKKSIPNHD